MLTVYHTHDCDVPNMLIEVREEERPVKRLFKTEWVTTTKYIYAREDALFVCDVCQSEWLYAYVYTDMGRGGYAKPGEPACGWFRRINNKISEKVPPRPLTT